MSDTSSPRPRKLVAAGKASRKLGVVSAAAAASPTIDSDADDIEQAKSSGGEDPESSPEVDDAAEETVRPILKRGAPVSKSIAFVELSSEDEVEAKDDEAEPALRERSVSRGRSQPRTALFSALTDRPARSLRDRISALASLRLGVGSVLLGALFLTLLLLALGAFGFVRFGSSTVSGSVNPLAEAEELQSSSVSASASASSLLRQIRSTLAEIRAHAAQHKMQSQGRVNQ